MTTCMGTEIGANILLLPVSFLLAVFLTVEGTGKRYHGTRSRRLVSVAISIPPLPMEDVSLNKFARARDIQIKRLKGKARSLNRECQLTLCASPSPHTH